MARKINLIISEEAKKKMSIAKTREKHSMWKGGKFITKQGYKVILLKKHEYPNKSGRYVMEHRYVMEKHLRRKLLPFPKETIHHIDGNKLNNSISNLEVISASNHAKIHNNIEKCNEKRRINSSIGKLKKCSNCNKIKPLHNQLKWMCRPCYRKIFLNNV